MELGSGWVVLTFRTVSLAALVAGGVGPLASPQGTPARPATASAATARAVAAGPWDVQVALPSFPRQKLAQCRASQISVAAAQQLGAAVSGGWLVRYRNISSSTCTLSGYPTVVGLVSPTGPATVAAHVSLGYLGGWQSAKPVPTVVLAARTGVASSIVEYVSDSTAQNLCWDKARPVWFHFLRLELPGSTRPFALPVPEGLFCSGLITTPIVPGTTGWAK